MLRCSSLRACAAAAMLPWAIAPQAEATWSIVIADHVTKEVAVGTVTCLQDFDLLALVPVVVVGRGAAAVQAAGDFDGTRRPIIFSHLQAGTPPEEILALLAQVSGHQGRQYGIVDTEGRGVTFTGSSTFSWAGGVVGSRGTIDYAVQGNVLTGSCVVSAIERAILDTDGDIPERLMAGMLAARKHGGDGRCSCSAVDPTRCGCPPAEFMKAGHIGTMVDARLLDADDPVCNAGGCADGNYFMKFDVPFQTPDDPDPVLQLQVLFDEWRAGRVGLPDAVQTTVLFEPPMIPPNGAATTMMRLVLRDFRGDPVTIPILFVSVTHGPDSDGISIIGEAIDLGDGAFAVPLTAGTRPGVDQFQVVVIDGVRPVALMPYPTLRYAALGDIDSDGDVDLADRDAFVAVLLDMPMAPEHVVLADLNGDGAPDGRDLRVFVDLLTG